MIFEENQFLFYEGTIQKDILDLFLNVNAKGSGQETHKIGLPCS
jgi:hypothetical protein